MSGDALIILGVLLWASLLLRNGRANSPRRRAQRARWDMLLREAVDKKPRWNDGGED